jgi:hypothetical protein
VTVAAKESKRREIGFTLFFPLARLVVDGIKKGTGFLEYASPIPDLRWFPPFWILGMWGLFGGALRGASTWLQGKSVPAAAAGAQIGPPS